MCYKVTSLLIFISAFSLSLNIGSVIGDTVHMAGPGDKEVPLECSHINQMWQRERDGKNITTKDDKEYKLVPENKTLIVLEADSNTMGVYICYNIDSPASTEKIILNVSPYVKHFEKSKNMIQDDPLHLECKGYGHPTPVVQWFKGETLLVADNNRITFKDIDAKQESMINGTLRIETMAYEDAGDYKCVATNDYGFNNATVAVKVKDKLAALWPFLGICAEVAILCTIIFIYERRRAKRMEEEENKAVEESERLNANNDTKVVDDVRQRKWAPEEMMKKQNLQLFVGPLGADVLSVVKYNLYWGYNKSI